MCPGLAQPNDPLAPCLNWKTGHQIVWIYILWIIHCGGVAANGMPSQMLISWNVHLSTKSLHMLAMYTYFYCNFWVTFGVQIFTCISDNYPIFVKQIIHLTLQQCQHFLVEWLLKHSHQKFPRSETSKTTPSNISCRNNLPSQVECLQYNNRLHMTVCFINFSRHSIIVDRAHGTGLIILAQNNSQHCNTSHCWTYISQYTHMFNGRLSGTTLVSRYPKGKNQPGFYWSKRQWEAVASAGPYASLHLAPDR